MMVVSFWRESIGMADVEKNRPATPNTPYGLASLGKSITATAVMVLVDRMEVNLNAPISAYIGEELADTSSRENWIKLPYGECLT